MILLLIASLGFASELPGEQLYVAPTVNAAAPSEVKPNTSSNVGRRAQSQKAAAGNLPSEYLVSLSRQSTNSELVQPPKGSIEILRALKIGDIIDVVVDHSVIAFPDEFAPVVATSEASKYRGLRFIGQSRLEPNSRRVFIEFSKVIRGDQIFDLKGTGIGSNGQPGFTGKYYSREAEFFAGDFISSFVAGYFDGLVPRRTNAYGQTETDQTVDSAVKKGLSSGALSSAERFRQKLKKVPEFSEIKGPFNLKILILDQAKSTN